MLLRLGLLQVHSSRLGRPEHLAGVETSGQNFRLRSLQDRVVREGLLPRFEGSIR